MKKVYCEDCKYLAERAQRTHGRIMNDILSADCRRKLFRCTHPDFAKTSDDPIRREVIFPAPESNNQDNLCARFKGRWFGRRFI